MNYCSYDRQSEELSVEADSTPINRKPCLRVHAASSADLHSQERTSCGLWRVGAVFLAILVTVKEALGKVHQERPLMKSEFRDFTGTTQARLTLITYRSVGCTKKHHNTSSETTSVERPRKVCPSALHEKPTSSSSTRQALRGNGGISRALPESNITECACANERFLPPFFLYPLPPTLSLLAAKSNRFRPSSLNRLSNGSLIRDWRKHIILKTVVFLQSNAVREQARRTNLPLYVIDCHRWSCRRFKWASNSKLAFQRRRAKLKWKDRSIVP